MSLLSHQVVCWNLGSPCSDWCLCRSWERFKLKPSGTGYNIMSHHGTALTLHDDSIYASKLALDGLPLTVSFVPVAEPMAGLTRFVPEIKSSIRDNDAGAGAAKRSKLSPTAADTTATASSPAVSPLSLIHI